MKKLLFFLAPVAMLALTSFSLSDPADWQLTDGYSVRFFGKKASGFFHTLKGTLRFDEKNLSSAYCKMEVDVSSISTGNSLKTWHARRPKWFDAKKYPTITFVSDKFQKTASGYMVTGKLKMRETEKPVSIPFTFTGNVFSGSFKVRRTDFNVGTTKGLSKMVSDTIRIDFTIPVKK